MTTDQPNEPGEPPDDDLVEPTAAAPYPRQRAIAALAANIGILLFCSPLFGLIGIVVATIGLMRLSSKPESARLFVRWAWIIAGVALVLFTVLTIWTLLQNEEEATLTLLRAARYV
jgi:hypothetical protein